MYTDHTLYMRLTGSENHLRYLTLVIRCFQLFERKGLYKIKSASCLVSCGRAGRIA